MTQEQLKNKIDELINAIREYRQEKNCDEIDLERLLDYMLCRLPRDMIYVEWFDRSDIKNMADSQLNNEEADEDLVDKCMEDLWDLDYSIMRNETVQDVVYDTVFLHNKGVNDDND